MGKDNDEAAGGFGSVFRDRLTYLMNGNNVYGKPVNTQELADEIDISRPAVRKYLKPNDRREVTVPSALVVSRIARYFRTTPNFLLGFDEAADDADAQRAGESDVYSSLGLSQEAIDGLHRLHAQAVTDPKAADLQRLRAEMLATTKQDLAAFAKRLDALARDAAVCVLAGPQQLEACTNRLDAVESVVQTRE